MYEKVSRHPSTQDLLNVNFLNSDEIEIQSLIFIIKYRTPKSFGQADPTKWRDNNSQQLQWVYFDLPTEYICELNLHKSVCNLQWNNDVTITQQLKIG